MIVEGKFVHACARVQHSEKCKLGSMSTDLYGVRVLDVDKATRRVRFTIFVLYYDTVQQFHQPLLDEPSFFLRVLHEPYGSGAALADEQRVFDEDWVDSNAWRYVESVTRLATRNEPVTDWNALADFYYERAGKWDHEETLVQADFDVVFTDATWIAHFKNGQSWGTASYPTRADMPGRAADALPDLRREVRHIVPFGGQRDDATPEDVMFTSDGKLLAITSQAGGLVVYDTATWTETMRGQIATSWAQGEFFPNSHVFALRDGDSGPVAGWNADTGESVSVELPPGRARSPSGLFRGLFGAAPGLQLYDEHGAALHMIGPDQHIEKVAFHPNDELVATVGMGLQVTFWRIADGVKLRTLDVDVDDDPLMHLGYSPDGRWLVASGGGIVSILDAETGAVVRRSKRHDGIPVETAWSERYVASLWVGDMGYGGYASIYELGALETKPETIVMEPPAAEKPTKKPAAKKPAAKKPAAKKPAAKKPAAKKPAASKSVARKSATKRKPMKGRR